MSEPERKRRRYRLSSDLGPGPPAIVSSSLASESSVPLETDWNQSRNCLDHLNQLLVKRCTCQWGVENLDSVLVPFGNRLASRDSPENEDILLFCSVVQTLCEEIGRQSSVENGENTKCCTLKRIRKMMFYLNSLSDVTPVLLTFFKSSDIFVSYAASQALVAWLKTADDGPCKVLLEQLLNEIIGPLGSSLSILNPAGMQGPLPHTVSHLLDTLHCCIETPDFEPHPTEGATEEEDEEDENQHGNEEFSTTRCICDGKSNTSESSACEEHFERDLEHESRDLKGNVIRALGKHWNVIVTHFHAALNLSQMQRNSSHERFPMVSFLSLWKSTISVKANVSVLDTKPFYARQEALLPLMTLSLDQILWREILNLFNEVLCYGSTLALQDFLPDEPCNLSHLIIRHVKNERLLDRAPVTSESSTTNGQKSLIQKLILLILKAIAVMVKETRCESSSLESESSSESGRSGSVRPEDSDDLHADMTVILRSIKQVLRLLDSRVKGWLPFHPEAPCSEWMVKIFSDQDDALVEAMLCSLDISNGLYSNCRGLDATSSSLNSGLRELKATLNPVQTWLRFLETVSYDPDVLLDLLVSNETCFLLYLLRLLKFIRRNWNDFLEALSLRQLEDVMTCLIRLRMAIRRLVTKNLFPYNIGPIVKLLEKCEELYEGKEN